MRIRGFNAFRLFCIPFAFFSQSLAREATIRSPRKVFFHRLNPYRASREPPTALYLNSSLKLRGGGDDKFGSPTLNAIMLLDYFGTAVFSFSGTLAAGRAGMDLYGCMVIASIVSFGGGTIRDVLLGRTPVFWMLQNLYFQISLVTSGITFFVWPLLEHFGVRDDIPYMCFADALGLGTFCVIGAEIGHEMQQSALICILCGVMTATFGGILRDLLCHQEIRSLMPRKSLYATPAILGAALYTVMIRTTSNQALSAYCGFLFAVVFRVLAWTYKFRLPDFLNHPVGKLMVSRPTSATGDEEALPLPDFPMMTEM